MTEENKIPQFMQNSIDFKKIVISYIFEMIDTLKKGELEGLSIGEKTTVRILTNFGIIDGKAINFDEESEKEILNEKNNPSALYAIANRGVDMTMADYEAKIGSDNLKVINQTGKLVLTDAVVTPYANPQGKFNISRMLIFTDQIVGVTFGEDSQ